MGPLQHRRMREHARRQANLWTGGAGGRTGLARPLLGGRRGVQTRYPVIVNSDVALPGPASDFVQPWAWYRGDDLTGYSEDDPVSEWPDRAGGIGTLTLTDANTAFYGNDVIGGQPGVQQTSFGYFYRSPIDSNLPIGEATFAMVVRPNDQNPVVTMYDGDNIVDFAWYGSYLWFEVGADFVTEDPYNPPDEMLLVGVASETELALWVNGQKITTASRSAGPYTFHEFGFRLDGCDVMVWNQALSDSQVGGVWAYAQNRYGL